MADCMVLKIASAWRGARTPIPTKKAMMTTEPMKTGGLIVELRHGHPLGIRQTGAQIKV
jgi:hypothetical protein